MSNAVTFAKSYDSDGNVDPGDYIATADNGTYRIYAVSGWGNRRVGYAIHFIANGDTAPTYIGSVQFHGPWYRGEATLAAAKATVRAHAA